MRRLTWSTEGASAIVDEALAVLTRGSLVAVPTETVYGLAARADSAEACARIYAAKGRPATHPLIVHVGTLEAACELVAAEAHGVLARWADRFWPGPLTLVLPRSARVPDLVAAGGTTVALRSPAHPVMAALLARAPFGLAAPSANRYQSISPTSADHVARSLGDAVDLLVDGGPCAVGLESTIVAPALTGDGSPSRVLRLGGLSLAELRAFDAHLVVDAGTDGADAIHAAPGRDRRHYAPSCAITFVISADELPAAAPGIGYLTWDERPREAFPYWRALAGEPDPYAHDLYAALHDAETAGIHTLYVRRLPEGEAWSAPRDRLTRAAER
jgi:L-threonylcarbamoyladenylate synthase